MQIYTGIRKGELHQVFCEDFLTLRQVSVRFHLFAVMDGCSSGVESHFASTLIGKILNKICTQLKFEFLDEFDAQSLGKVILEKLFAEMIFFRNQLLLDKFEMLATTLLLIYDDVEKNAFIAVIGDGFVQIEDTLHTIDQENRPDYLAYHLGEDFDAWFASLKNTFLVKNPTEISISTDGIDTFKSMKTDLPENFDVIDYLLKDNFLENNPNMLQRKMRILETQYGFQPADDVAIIRVKF